MATPSVTKTFDGKRYTIVTVLDPKSKAEKRAEELRQQGKKAKIVKVPKAKKREPGYTRTRWAVYARN